MLGAQSFSGLNTVESAKKILVTSVQKHNFSPFDYINLTASSSVLVQLHNTATVFGQGVNVTNVITVFAAKSFTQVLFILEATSMLVIEFGCWLPISPLN